MNQKITNDDKKTLATILEYLDTASEQELKTDKRVLLNVIKFINEKDITLEEFARKLNYKEKSSMGGLILRGQRGLSVNALIKIAQILDVDIVSLLPEETRRNKNSLEQYIESIIKKNVQDDYLKKE